VEEEGDTGRESSGDVGESESSDRVGVIRKSIDGVDYTTKIVIGVKQGKKYYDHDLTRIEKERLVDSLNLIAKKVADQPVSESNVLSRIKDTKLILILQA
jgi:hypothetical protein